MSLRQALLETIDVEWSQQGNDEDAYLTTVYIHRSLGKAIEDSGEEVPKEFNPNEFHGEDAGTYWCVGIEMNDNQDILVGFEYE